MKHTTERKWHSWRNGVNVGKTKEVVMNFRRNSVDHPPLTIDSLTESAALNSWRCRSQRISPGPPHHLLLGNHWDNFLTRCSSKVNSIVKEPTHPSHSLFQLLPSGRRYRRIRARSARQLNSFYSQAVRTLNSTHTTPLWNPIQTPYLRKHGPLPPHTHTQPYHITEKNGQTFLCNSMCATHR